MIQHQSSILHHKDAYILERLLPRSEKLLLLIKQENAVFKTRPRMGLSYREGLRYVITTKVYEAQVTIVISHCFNHTTATINIGITRP